MLTREAASLLAILAASITGVGSLHGDIDAESHADRRQQPDTMADESLKDGTDVSGIVLDAVTGLAIRNADVRLSRPDESDHGHSPLEVASTRTSANGHYSFKSVPAADNYRVTIDTAGFKHEKFHDVTLYPASHTLLETARLVSEDYAGSGDITGVVRSLIGGMGASGVSVSIRRGINRRTGEIIASTRTGSDGRFRIGGIDYGNMTAEYAGDSFRTTYKTLRILGVLPNNEQDIALLPIFAFNSTDESNAVHIAMDEDERSAEPTSDIVPFSPTGAL